MNASVCGSGVSTRFSRRCAAGRTSSDGPRRVAPASFSRSLKRSKAKASRARPSARPRSPGRRSNPCWRGSEALNPARWRRSIATTRCAAREPCCMKYAMRCASTRSLDPIRNLGSKGVAVINGLEGSALDSFAWLNLAPVGRRRIDLNALQRLWAKWPDGCPPLIEDAEAFVKFAQDCVLAGLLDRRGRTELQAAVAKAWEQPAVNRKQMVFVSYSHQQADLAQRLADGLRDLGVGAVLDRYELDRDASGAVLETWIAESLMRSVTTVYLLSEDVRLSGWVHRESEWQMRLLGIKPSLVLPYIVIFDHSDSSARYPRSRTIYGNALVKQPTKTIKQLAGRLTIDWLLTLKARKLDQNFGIAYQGKQIVEIVAKPESSSLGSDGS